MSPDRTSAENPSESTADARAELRRLGAEVDRLRAEYQARCREAEQLRVNPCALCEQPIPLWLFSKRSRAVKRAVRAYNAAVATERTYRKEHFARLRGTDAKDEEAAEPTVPGLRDVMPKPHGWRDPRHLLGDLLQAFGWRAEDMSLLGPVPPRARAGQPADPAERNRLYKKELEEAEPVLRELVKRAETLRGGPMRKPSDYEREWRSIVETWNEAIRTQRWFEMTPLCEVCGKALFRRAPWYSRSEPRQPLLGFACSDSCSNTKHQREHRQRAKLSPHPDEG